MRPGRKASRLKPIRTCVALRSCAHRLHRLDAIPDIISRTRPRHGSADNPVREFPPPATLPPPTEGPPAPIPRKNAPVPRARDLQTPPPQATPQGIAAEVARVLAAVPQGKFG